MPDAAPKGSPLLPTRACTRRRRSLMRPKKNNMDPCLVDRPERYMGYTDSIIVAGRQKPAGPNRATILDGAHDCFQNITTAVLLRRQEGRGRACRLVERSRTRP